MSIGERPSLSCPACDVPLIPAEGRGRIDRDGNDIVHADDCRCRWCGWLWWEEVDPVECACGAQVYVVIDDAIAFAKVRT
jgi:hypothetical protein